MVERIQFEEPLRAGEEQQARDARMLEAVGKLAGGVAHSFNNLMMTILGHSEIMLDGMEPGDAFFASVQEIHKSATRTASLTQKLSAFGRRQILTLSQVDLNATICDLAVILRHMKAGVRLELSLATELGLLEVDRHYLEEAILTLFRNACGAMPDGGRVSIATASVELGLDFTKVHPDARPGSYVRLTISDTGTGMNAEMLSHLFEPFYSEAASVGSGMGLAAVYGFIKQCGGEIEVSSQLDQGTTFQLYLPRKATGLQSPGLSS